MEIVLINFTIVDATGNHISEDIDSNTGNCIASADMVNVDLVPEGVMEQHTQPDNAWVHCDDCHKWRRIPVAFVKSIDEACRWYTIIHTSFYHLRMQFM